MVDQSWLGLCQRALAQGLGVDGQVVFGAILGALLVSLARGRMKVWLMVGPGSRRSVRKSVVLMVLSTGVGYLFEPLLLNLLPLLSKGMAAFSAAVVVIPISLKIMVWLDALDLAEVLQRLRRRS